MQVMNYAPTKRHLIGAPQSGYWVICVWYTNGRQHCQVFNQDVLVKLQTHNGLFNHLVDNIIGQIGSNAV